VRDKGEGGALAESEEGPARSCTPLADANNSHQHKFVIPSGAERRDLRAPHPLTPATWKRRPQICHPDRSEPGFPATRHSPTSTYAAFVKESRMKFANATNLNRKSGVAKWRDLLCALLPNNFRLSDCSPNLLSRLKWSEEEDKKEPLCRCY
jgi:hypothetical protein